MNFFAIVSKGKIPENLDPVISSINLSGRFGVENLRNRHFAFGSASLKNSPLKGDRLYENKTWIIAFGGDVVDYRAVPHERIIDILESGDFSGFKKFNGYFSVTAFHKEQKKLHIVSDRTSQYPIYYYIHDDGAWISSEIATFCRLDHNLKFNEAWMWEYLYFNFPVEDTSIIRGVKRMLPASILTYDLESGLYALDQYAGIFKEADSLIRGQDALDQGLEVFRERFPKYFEGADEIACALTNGWDARIVLALAPQKETVTAYTYGPPNCRDIIGARKTARLLGQKHIEIPLDSTFVDNLPNLAKETVYLTSGSEKVLRSSMMFVYGALTEQGTRFPLTMSGIAISGILRGHMMSPMIISNDMTPLMEGGSSYMNEATWSQAFNNTFPEFKEHIFGRLETLRGRFGDFRDTAFHLSYLVYCLSPKHFNGEIKMASNYTTVRVPGWDPALQALVFNSERSALSYSARQKHRREGRQEVVLQSYILSKLTPQFRKIPVQNTRPDIVLKGSAPYLAYRIFNGSKNRLLNLIDPKRATALRDGWDRWVNHANADFFEGLIFSKDARVREYFQEPFLTDLKASRNLQNIGKLATLEIILRLVGNGWKRYW